MFRGSMIELCFPALRFDLLPKGAALNESRHVSASSELVASARRSLTTVASGLPTTRLTVGVNRIGSTTVELGQSLEVADRKWKEEVSRARSSTIGFNDIRANRSSSTGITSTTSNDVSVGGRAVESVWAGRPALAAALPDRRSAGDPVTPTLYVEALQRLASNLSMISHDVSGSANRSCSSTDTNLQKRKHSPTNENISAVLSHALVLVQETLSAKRSMFERGSRLAPFNSWQVGGDNEDLHVAALACLKAAAACKRAGDNTRGGIEWKHASDHGAGLALLTLLRRNGASLPTAATVAALELATGIAAVAGSSPLTAVQRTFTAAPSAAAIPRIDTSATAGVPIARDASVASRSEGNPLPFTQLSDVESQAQGETSKRRLTADVLRAVAEHEQSLQDSEVDVLLGLSGVGGGGSGCGDEWNIEDGHGASTDSSTASSSAACTAQSLEAVAYAAVCALASSSCGHDWRGAVRVCC